MRSVFVLAALAVATAVHAEEPQGRWHFVGVDQFSDQIKYYVIPEEIKEFEPGVFIVAGLAVHSVMVAGVEFPDGNGELWLNTDYPHRSRLDRRVIDCNQEMDAVFETRYFSSVSPASETLVHSEKVDSPILFPIMMEDPVYSRVCGDLAPSLYN